MSKVQLSVIWIAGMLLLGAVLVPPWKFVGQTQLVFPRTGIAVRELQAPGPYALLFRPPVIPLTSYSEKTLGIISSSPSGYFNGFPRGDWNAIVDTPRVTLTCVAIVVPTALLLVTLRRRKQP